MIICRSPLRISLGGGGTDLKSYYGINNGFLVSAAIDKYVYINLSTPFGEYYNLRYSDYEKVNNLIEIKHNIFRESLIKMASYTPNEKYEITSTADIPAGTGLGSSGSFTVALLKALSLEKRIMLSNEQIAEKACEIEIDILKQPIGKQDQYISAIGGICSFSFNKDDSVAYAPLNISKELICKLEDNLLLFFTGYTRDANSILDEQNKKSIQNDVEMLKNLDLVKQIGFKTKDLLEQGNFYDFGLIMNEHWENKKKRSKTMSSPLIDECYSGALKNGAVGGKVVGAGGGGFLMFYANDPEKLRVYMKKFNFEELRFRFDFLGVTAINF